MVEGLEFAPVILNGAVTFTIGSLIVYLIHIGRLKKNLFYFAWAFGFMAYGIEIILRDHIDEVSLALVGGVMYSFLALGAWSLSNLSLRKIVLAVPIIIVSGFLYLTGSFPIALIPFPMALTLFYGLISVGIIYNRAIFGRILDKLVLGWFFLLMVNLLLWEQWIIDIFAVFAKIVLFLGILDQEFVLVAEKIRIAAQRYPSISPGVKKEGGVNLIIPTPDSSTGNEVNWMEDKIQENVREGVDTYVFSFQDLPSHSDLRRMRWINPEKVFVLLFSSSSLKAREEFTVFKMDITEMGATLFELIRKYYNVEEGCVVIFTDLSVLIHSFNVDDVFNMLLEKMGSLREAGVTLYAFFHPETHGDPAIANLFKNISDSVLKL